MIKGDDFWFGCKLSLWILVFDFLSSMFDAKDSLLYYFVSLCPTVANIFMPCCWQLSSTMIFDVSMCFLVSMGFEMIFTMDVVFGFVTLLLILPHVIICILKWLHFYLVDGVLTKSRYFGQSGCVQIGLIY